MLVKTAVALKPSSGAKLAAALLLAMAAGTKAAEDCTAARTYGQQPKQEEQGLLMVLMLAVTLLLTGVAVGCRLRGKFDEVTLQQVKTRAVQVQTPL